ILLIVGWRQGWFLESAVREKTTRTKSQRAPAQIKAAQRRRGGRSAPVRERARPHVDDMPEEPRRPRLARVGHPSDPDMDDDLPIHPAVAAAARKAGVQTAESALPDHWAVDTIKSRPGWLMFEIEDFLGETPTAIGYNIPGVRRQGSVKMYLIRDVRDVEKGDNIVAASRRKVITSRWRDRAENRESKPKGTTKSPKLKPDELPSRPVSAGGSRR
ncbi:MAG: hypothetical protein AAGC70_21045, partial [Pseudomonadota bacterium]